MTQKELQDTTIVTGLAAAYIAKKTKNKNEISQVRREITKSEILGLIVWYSKQKFEEDNCDEYDVMLNGKSILTIKKNQKNDGKDNPTKKIKI